MDLEWRSTRSKVEESPCGVKECAGEKFGCPGLNHRQARSNEKSISFERNDFSTYHHAFDGVKVWIYTTESLILCFLCSLVFLYFRVCI
jgi:hypothetical protein